MADNLIKALDNNQKFIDKMKASPVGDVNITTEDMVAIYELIQAIGEELLAQREM